MSTLGSRLSKPSTFLISEFVIIVLGVLVALAVDSWRVKQKEREVRRYLIDSLLSDLRDDKGDYAEFVGDSNERHASASLITQLAGSASELTEEDYEQARSALNRLGITSRLETVESTFIEMSSLGTGATIEDTELRLRVSSYYGLARDRSDINDSLEPGILRYRASLEELGISYVDRETIDVDAVLSNRKTLAIVRELGVWAAYVEPLVADLVAANSDLITRLEAVQQR